MVPRCGSARPFVVKAEVVIPDHLHMIWTLPEADADYATRIRLMKQRFQRTRSTVRRTAPCLRPCHDADRRRVVLGVMAR